MIPSVIINATPVWSYGTMFTYLILTNVLVFAGDPMEILLKRKHLYSDSWVLVLIINQTNGYHCDYEEASSHLHIYCAFDLLSIINKIASACFWPLSMGRSLSLLLFL